MAPRIGGTQEDTIIPLASGGGSQIRRSLLVPAVSNIALSVLCAALGVGFGFAAMASSPSAIGLIALGAVTSIGCFSAALCCFNARSQIVGDQVSLSAATKSHRRSKVIVWITALVGIIAVLLEGFFVWTGASMGALMLGLSVVLFLGALGTLFASVEKIARLAALNPVHS